MAPWDPMGSCDAFVVAVVLFLSSPVSPSSDHIRFLVIGSKDGLSGVTTDLRIADSLGFDFRSALVIRRLPRVDSTLHSNLGEFVGISSILLVTVAVRRREQ